MQIKIEDKVYDINKIEDDQIKLDANVLIAKINQHRLNAEGFQILVNTFENSLNDLLKKVFGEQESSVKSVDKSS
jgi:hypothetical protein